MNTVSQGPEAVIDLGGGWREPLPEPGATGRRLRAAALALAAVLPLALGGAAPPTVGLVEVARVSVADARATDLVFAGGAVLLRGQGRLTAYELADGAPRWSVELPDRPEMSNIVVSPAVPDVAVIAQSDGSGAEFSVALDLATGTELWRIQQLMVPAGDTVYTMGSVYATNGAPAIQVHDLRTGARLWTMPDAVNAAFDDKGGTAWTVSPDGLVTAYAGRDGRVLRSGRVRLPATVDSAFAGGGELAVGYTTDAGHRVAWFDGTTLAELPRPAPDGWGVDCGALLRCVRTSDSDRGLEVIDRATGTVVRRLTTESYLSRGSHLFIFDREGDMDGGLGLRPRTLIDLGTGLTTDVAGWEVLWQQVPVTVLVRLVEKGKVLQVARLGPDGPEILAQLPGDVQRCAFEQRTLLCTRYGGQAILWRLRD
ncbi:PQQ-binding-like beta-propeller repeat protein [Catellatospora sp. NPDC049111]|uniref:outer membrane protein assembly factor BamB family protein n=1 Tax=Catellatospora sp. NPDC049111 TaxID=3155271 RepID=UPI0033E67222